MGKFIDRTGEVFGQLLVLLCTQRACRSPKKKTKWLCLCVCGDKSEYQSSNLTSGNSTCCIGCRSEKQVVHGHARRDTSNNTHSSWGCMKGRCNNPKDENYHNYGGRGIHVDPLWDTYPNFLRDMGECPVGLTLERVDVEKGYSKDNCIWATRAQQSYNRRMSNKNTSGVEGVWWRKDTNKWTAYFNHEGVRYMLGCFYNKEDAIKARQDKEIEIHGKIKGN